MEFTILRSMKSRVLEWYESRESRGARLPYPQGVGPTECHVAILFRIPTVTEKVL